MTNEAEKFLKAEQAAEELVRALEKLHDETVTYKTSTTHLEAVRDNLVTFIEASQRISQDTKTAVELLKSIGGPEILGSLQQLDEKVGYVTTEIKTASINLTRNIAELDSKVGGISYDANNNIKMIAERLSGIDANIGTAKVELKSFIEQISDSISTELAANAERTDKLKKFVLVAIGVSALTLVASIITLIK